MTWERKYFVQAWETWKVQGSIVFGTWLWQAAAIKEIK